MLLEGGSRASARTIGCFRGAVSGWQISWYGRTPPCPCWSPRRRSRGKYTADVYILQDSPGGLSTQTTPSGAPTPISAGFGREGSGNATPTSATARAGVKKKRGKGEGDDSEMEEREGKKARAGARK